MNNVLNFNRLWWLIRRQAVENYKFYLLAIALMAGLLMVGYILSFRALGYDVSAQELWFILSLLLSSSVFINILLKELHGTTSAIWNLMLPVSAVEKIVLVIFYSVIVFVPVHLLIFYAIDIPFVNYYNAYYTDGKHGHAFIFDLWKENRMPLFYYSFLSIQAVTLLGSIWFKRYSYVKTAAVLFVFILFIYFTNILILSSLISKQVSGAVPFTYFWIIPDKESDTQWLHVLVPGAWLDVLGIVGKFLVAPFLWIIAYYRLRETQVR